MRALITTDTLGGVWRFTHELVTGLLEAGESVALVSFGALPSPDQSAECADLASRWSDTFLYVPSDVPLEWMQNNELCFKDGAVVIEEVAEQFVPESVHTNQFCFGALELGVPKIVTAHSDVLSWARACRGEALEESPWLARYRRLVQRGLDGAVGVTAPTIWMLRALGQAFELRGELRVISNGIDIASVSRSEQRRLQAVTVGRLWDEAKGLTILEDVSSPMPLLAAGETLRDGACVPCPAGIKLLGFLDRNKILRLFHQSEVYVCTSLYEPFGLAPLEAALCGCAVVVRKIPSLLEVWGDSALYFQDAEELSEILTWLYEDRESLRKAQQRAISHAGRYTRRAMVESYRNLYFSVREMASVS
jgi:glycogen(starch) synthase